jgi:hypothetical protein
VEPFELSKEDRQAIRTHITRRPTDGLYQILGGVYESMEAAAQWTEQRCLSERLPFLSLLDNYEKQLQRDREEAERWGRTIETGLADAKKRASTILWRGNE